MKIGTIKRYAHGPHGWLIGLGVRIVAIHRDGQILTNDDEIGQVLPTDVIEVRPWISEEDRWSFVTSDATLDQLVDL